MSSILSYRKNSYSFSKKEYEILIKMLDFFKYEIPEGNGSYLLMLDLDKINFKWCPKMILDDQGVFGSWTFGDTNNVYIRPSEFSKSLYEKISSPNFVPSKREKEKAESIKFIFSKFENLSLFDNLNIDQELLNFILYLIENDGIILSTIFHELYHKWQYKNGKLFYIMNFFVFSLIGYERSIKSKYSLEGDVRIYVDCDELHQSINDFYNVFYTFISSMKNMIKYENTYNKIKEKQLKIDNNEKNEIILKYESSKETLENLKIKSPHFYKFSIELFSYIQLY